MTSLVDAFAWPLGRPVRLYILAGLALAIGSLRSIPATAADVALAFAAGCAVSWLFSVVRRATHPEDRRPETLDREIDRGEAGMNLLQFLGAAAAAYLPLAGFAAYGLWYEVPLFDDPDFRVVLAALATSGTIYFPMALLLLGYTGHWAAPFNVPLGLRGMGRLGGGYALCVAGFLAAGAAAAALELGVVRRLPPLTLAGWVARTSTSWAELYLAAVAMRALGLLYLARGARLDWVARPRT
jgi:hypothetical protein